MEVRIRFKGLALIECLKNYGRRFMTLYRRQGSRPYSWEKKKFQKMGIEGTDLNIIKTIYENSRLTSYSMMKV